MTTVQTESARTVDPSTKIPLSLQQEFLCLFDQGDETGPFGPRFHHVDGWRIRGALDVEALRLALADVVARHESLRTLVVRDAADRHQRVLAPSTPELLIADLSEVPPDERDHRAELLINEVESGTMSVRELPLLRAVLGRFDDRDAVLVLVAHHTAVDAWSVQLVMRDLAACYAVRRGYEVDELPAVQPYREYAIDQRANLSSAATARSCAYWRDKLRDARIVALPTDRLRSAAPDFSTSWHRYAIGADLRSATVRMARTTRSSPFMVLLSAFMMLVHDMTGATDIVMPTFTPGRGQARFLDTVGSFFNFLPLRTDINGCGSFHEVVERTRATCLQAYQHELTLAQILAEAPELMAPGAVDGLAPCVIQVVQTPFTMDRTVVGDLEYTTLWRRLLSQPVGSDIPDGMLWGLQLGPSDDILGDVAFSSNLYDEDTVVAMVSAFEQVLAGLLADPDAPLTLARRPMGETTGRRTNG